MFYKSPTITGFGMCMFAFMFVNAILAHFFMTNYDHLRLTANIRNHASSMKASTP